MLTKVGLLVLGLLLALASAGAAVAAGPESRLGIAPLNYPGQFFDLTMRPGESRELKVEVGNYGVGPINARTYPANVYTTVNGGFGADLDGEAPSGTTLWIDYPRQTLELDAGKALQQGFSVRVPADAKPGEYATSLVVENATPETPSTSGGVTIRQVRRNVLAVVVTVPGERLPALSMGGFEHRVVAGASVISAKVRNTGNVRLKPSGTFVLRDKEGKEVTRYVVAMDTFYAGTSTTVEVPFAGLLNEGDYLASFELSDAAGGVTTRESETLQIKIPKGAPPAPSMGAGRAASNSGSHVPAGMWFTSAAPLALWAFVMMLVLGMAALLVLRARSSRGVREATFPLVIEGVDPWRGQRGQRGSGRERHD